MYKLLVKEQDKETELEFETAELARLYRDYHLAFGHWNGKSKWLEESKTSPEMRKFIVDEMTELRDGKIVRIYRVTDGIELKLEKAEGFETVEECWKLAREARDELLKACDWTQIPDNSLSQEERKDYRNYRNYLRGFPSLHNDDSIVMARIFTFKEWKEGSR